MPNAYYEPEKLGLTIFAEIEYSSRCYEFDTRVVWENEEGILFTARDSGCSCPTPFENFNSISDLTLLDNISWLEEEVNEESEYTTAETRQEFLRNISNKLNNRFSNSFFVSK
jgi:hypothetical protein